MKFKHNKNNQPVYVEHLLIQEHIKIDILLKEVFEKICPGLYIGLTSVGYKDDGNEYSLSPEKNGKYSIRDFQISNNDIKFIGNQSLDCIFLSVSDVPFGGAYVKLFIELNKNEYNGLFKFSSQNTRFVTYESVVDALVKNLKNTIHDLYRSDKSLSFDMPSVAETSKNACRSFLQSLQIDIYGCNAERFDFNLFDNLQDISFQKYEKKSVHGSIIFASKNDPNLQKVIEFEKEYRISEIRRIRKYLELTSDNQGLLADSGLIYGVGYYNKNPSQVDNFFVVNFVHNGEWNVCRANDKIMSIKNGNPSIHFQKISKQEIESRLNKEFKNATSDDVNCLCESVFSLIAQNKGGILVVSDISKNEAKRLGNDSTKIKPMKINSKNIAKMSSIDGAILVDEHCICYAIGVILDGFATQKGNSTRGARYNSSVRYSEFLLKKGAHVLVIIISDDGSVNVLPELDKKDTKCFAKRILERFVYKSVDLVC